MEHLREWVEFAATLIEALAVMIMLGLILVGTAKWLFSGTHITEGYQHYRVILGRSLLVGLELLVAADIISTVALRPTLLGIGTLAFLVLVRTFLGWSVTLELEARWPWQAKNEAGPETDRKA